MTTEPLDRPVYEYTDAALARPVPAALLAARGDVLAAAAILTTLPETSLTRMWDWIGGSEEEARYGAYRAAEALELAEVEARALAAPAEADERQAARIIGPATAARWDLHGLLVPMDDALLDAAPGGDEWPIRIVLAHVVSGQRGYAWGSAWWLGQRRAATDPDLPAVVPESIWEAMPDEDEVEGVGTVADIRVRLDEILDLSAERFAGLPDADLAIAARWSGFPVTLGFRFGRWGSHIREHTIHVEKTFAMLGHVPDEPARLARHVLAAYGRTEAVVFGRTGVDDAIERVAAGAAEALEAVRGAAAAGA